MDNNYAIGNGDRLLADSVIINGTAFDSAGVKYKGNSSYNPNNPKNPLNIKLDYVKLLLWFKSFKTEPYIFNT